MAKPPRLMIPLIVLLLVTASSGSSERSVYGSEKVAQFDEINNEEPIITLQRTACLGSCSDYKVSIYDGGTVVYGGRFNVATTGTVIYTIPVENVEAMLEEFEKADFISLEDAYAVQVFDMPSTITSLNLDGEIKEIHHYGIGCGSSNPILDNAPAELCHLEGMIDELANTTILVRGDE